MSSNNLTLTENFYQTGKKDLKSQAQLIAQEHPDKVQAFAAAKRLEEFGKQLQSNLKPEVLEQLDDEPLPVAGGKLSWRGGGFGYRGEKSFGHWDAWQEAMEKVEAAKKAVSEIESLMKAADRPSAELYHEGEQVPAAIKVELTPSIVYTY